MPQCAKKRFGDCIVQPISKKCNIYNESGFLRIFIWEYSIVLNLARKVHTLLHKMSFAVSTDTDFYWHALCLNLENLGRGSRLTFCARFVALYFAFFIVFSSGIRVQNNSRGLSKTSARPNYFEGTYSHGVWAAPYM